VVLLVIFYVWPTVTLLTRVDSAHVRAATEGRFLEVVGYALSFAVVPILLFATVAPALAWAAARAGVIPRLAVRATLALPLAAFAPVGLATVWYINRLANLPFDARLEQNGRGVMVATMTAFVLA